MPLPEERAASIERGYAHFHRVLADLLEELAEHGDPFWLEATGHDLRGDYQTSTYNPAVYRVPDMGPYRVRLAELDSVQAEVLALSGRKRPGPNLLPPLQAEDVQHVRLGRHEGQTGRSITREQALVRLEQLEATQAKNLREFEQHATRHDARRKAVEKELRQLQRAIERLKASDITHLRETYRQTVIRPYVYFLDGTTEQMHMRNTGLIAAGPRVSIEEGSAVRKVRSDKISLKPLISAGSFAFHDLSRWEAARERAANTVR